MSKFQEVGEALGRAVGAATIILGFWCAIFAAGFVFHGIQFIFMQGYNLFKR